MKAGDMVRFTHTMHSYSRSSKLHVTVPKGAVAEILKYGENRSRVRVPAETRQTPQSAVVKEVVVIMATTSLLGPVDVKHSS